MSALPPALEVRDLHVYYGESHVLQGVSLTVRAGEVVALLGRNGAGKTTTLRGALSGGQQQLLAIARALCGNPRVLLLDEPSEGLAPLIVRELGEAVRRLKGTLPVLLAEQNARFAVRLCDRGVVLEKGRVRFEGTRAQLEADPEIQGRYLSV